MMFMVNKVGMFSATLLNMLPIGIIVLNGRGQIFFANAFAADILLAGTDLKAVNGVLRVRSGAHGRALSEALKHLTNAETPEPIGFNVARTNRRPLSIVAAKLPNHGKTSIRPERRKIAVFLSDPELNHGLSAALLRDLFQFTPVESQIAILMMHSPHTAAVADELDITRNTLRDHLKSMFYKSHTRNQGELLHILLRCPAALRFPSQP